MNLQCVTHSQQSFSLTDDDIDTKVYMFVFDRNHSPTCKKQAEKENNNNIGSRSGIMVSSEEIITK